MVGRRDHIVRLLRTSSEPRSITSIADELGVHPNTVRFHLDALLRGGRVEQVFSETVGPGRPPALFRASRGMDPTGPTNYRLLATMLASHFSTSTDDAASAAAELGRSWGPSLIQPRPHRAPSKTQSVSELIGVLEDLGFRPEPPDRRRVKQVRLRHCPFHDIVQTHGDMICALHLGLMQGALAAMRGPVTVGRLDPIVEPDLCVAHLQPTSAPAEASDPRAQLACENLAPR
jgi:predicted ArsR family transcriptional regulator